MSSKPAKRLCKIKGCKLPYLCTDLCQKHYHRRWHLDNRQAILEQKRQYRLDNRQARVKYRKQYSHSFEGMIARMYGKMSGRVRGVSINPREKHYWYGKPLMEREAFLALARGSNELHRLHKQWSNQSFARKFTPCPDRLDSTKGYTADNIEFVTCSQNSVRANQTQKDNNAKIAYTLVGIKTNVHGQRKVSKPMRPGQRQAINDLVKVKLVKGTHVKK